MESKRYGLNIWVANVTNLVTTYLQLFPNIYFVLAHSTN